MESNIFISYKYSSKHNGYGVYYRIRDCRGKRFQVFSGFYTPIRFTGCVFPSQDPDARTKTSQVKVIKSRIDAFLRLNKEIYGDELKRRIQDLLGRETSIKDRPKILIDFIYEYAEGMKPSTATLYRLTADRVKEFDELARIIDVDAKWLMGFEVYLRQKGLSVNGIGQKMRNIRAVLNYCRDEGYEFRYPFGGRRGYIIREELPTPNNLTAKEFVYLRDYPCESWQQIYKDLFCLSFYLAGINIGDLLLCKGLTNGRLVFTRRKTDKSNAFVVRPISLPVYPEAMEIIEKYKGKNYLLNIMDNIKDYHTFSKQWNKALKKIGTCEIVKDKVGKLRKRLYHPIFPNLTTYSARYTFASIAANDLDISEQTIGKCLGHSWANGMNVTSRYISHDQKNIDNAIRKVIDYVNTLNSEL